MKKDCQIAENITSLIILFTFLVLLKDSYALVISSGQGYSFNTSKITTFSGGDIGFLGTQDKVNNETSPWLYANYRYAKISLAENGKCSNYDLAQYANHSKVYCVSLPTQSVVFTILKLDSDWDYINITIDYIANKTVAAIVNVTIPAEILNAVNSSSNISDLDSNISLSDNINSTLSNSSLTNSTSNPLENSITALIDNVTVSPSNNTIQQNSLSNQPEEESPLNNSLTYFLTTLILLVAVILMGYKLAHMSY
jgi:hypothetical protein